MHSFNKTSTSSSSTSSISKNDTNVLNISNTNYHDKVIEIETNRNEKVNKTLLIEKPLKKYNKIPTIIEDNDKNTLDKYDIGRIWSLEKFGNKHYYEYIVSFSIFSYWTLVSIIPVYNKIFFQKQYYPYPIATAGIQLFLVSIILIMINTIQYYCNTGKWIFDSNFLWKLKWIFPVGILFGLKYGITNIGLSVVPASTHVLLQSTDLVWTLLGAWYINGERVTPVGITCLLGCIAGTICLSLQINQSITAPLYAICVNLTSPMLLGLCITTLRSACMELMRGENAICSMQLTALKLLVSCSIALVMAMIFENDNHHTSISWYNAFLSSPTSTKLGVVCGSLPILLFQVNCTFLTFLTTSVSVGLVGQVKILPQWILALFFAPHTNTGQHFHFSRLNIIGAILTVLSAAAFAWNNYITIYNDDDDNLLVGTTTIPKDDVGNEEEHLGLLDCCSNSSNSSASSMKDESPKTYSSFEDCKDRSSCPV